MKVAGFQCPRYYKSKICSLSDFRTLVHVTEIDSKTHQNSRKQTLLALLFSRYSSRIPALAEEEEDTAKRPAAARPNSAALLPSLPPVVILFDCFESEKLACWALITGNLTDATGETFELPINSDDRTPEIA